MIKFKDLCQRTDKTPEEVRKIIKGRYKMSLNQDLSFNLKAVKDKKKK